MNTAPLTAEQYRKLAEVNRKFARRCIDPDVASQYQQLAVMFDDIAKRLEPLSWAFCGEPTEAATAA